MFKDLIECSRTMTSRNISCLKRKRNSDLGNLEFCGFVAFNLQSSQFEKIIRVSTLR